MSDDRIWHPSRLLLALPGLVTVLLILVGSVPIGAPLVGPVLPAFGMIAVFVFAVQRPDLMPHWLAFLIGLAQDLVTGGPLGLNALLLMVVQAVCAGQRRFLVGRPFALAWAGFAVIALPAALAQWLIACIYFAEIVPIGDVMLQAGSTVALFPFVAAPLLYVAHRLGQEQPA
ncbi:rod shape-determining protein MreD [Minwuia thermotolerans]|uniref:Rod shape-determining protein MreD n=1 Tax=Minwuia thermotolerans TaxID=2056226 RepID=A0A2M9G615_9PROT|nr:rod shape-determining protein MreD [Minwuia thermotolerans]ANK82291.1 MAG: rod shape-determining protein MreD [Rhizobiales bacterium NRL2]PJK31153.1 rod shape-determining protein MreD [Minwuia thermotolerans]